ncbi:MAG: amidophosphoribosyltransferase [Campylobacter sp.]|nr:amidophosphoribosyltransferase [Campylobacter sp.]
MGAVVGVINSKNASRLAYYALFSMQHRGQEASGISVSFNHHIKTHKGLGLVNEVFNNEILDNLKGDMAIGHNRYGTAGSKKMTDAQPISANYLLGEISVSHNGNFTNSKEVKSELIKEGAIFHTNMDTENIIHLIARSRKKHLKERIIEALNVVKGAYCLIIMSRSKMFVIRDRYGIRPLSVGRLKDGGYIVVSETCAFDLVGASFVQDVEPGQMLIFEEGKDEFESVTLFSDTDPRICAFEYIYFARPDSTVEGKNVYSVRKNLGKTLAQKSKTKADMVIPVPDSGVPAALGYAQESGIPFEMAIVRNHYVGRTFIEPTQDMRNLKVKLKLNPMGKILNGKSIIVIDDSIVRGTTSKKIVELLRVAGASEIHFKVAASEIKFPDIYGIDTPTKEELISYKMSADEIRKYIGADSLEFLDINELVRAIGDNRKYSLVSFDGDYFAKK